MTLIRHFMYKFSRFVVPDFIFSRLPSWHIDLDLKETLCLSQKNLNCTYIHLEQEVHSLEQRKLPIQLVSGSRDSYVTPAVTERIAESLNGMASINIFEKAKHNKSRDRHPAAYDQLLVDFFDEHLAAAVLPESRAA